MYWKDKISRKNSICLSTTYVNIDFLLTRTNSLIGSNLERKWKRCPFRELLLKSLQSAKCQGKSLRNSFASKFRKKKTLDHLRDWWEAGNCLFATKVTGCCSCSNMPSSSPLWTIVAEVVAAEWLCSSTTEADISHPSTCGEFWELSLATCKAEDNTSLHFLSGEDEGREL